MTGACYLLEAKNTKMLVDCGFFQGRDECSDLNFGNFQFDPSSIDVLVISHAHIDHMGRVPKLVAEGFSGVIYSTAPTRDIARLLLEDALHLQERMNKAIYSAQDIEKTFSLWKDVSYNEKVQVGDIEIQLNDAGHILGSSMIEVWAEEKHMLFTGDIGNVPSELLPSPKEITDMEYLVIESAYGNRTHESADERRIQLERAVEDAVARGGALMIPAFATERTQDILFSLNQMLFHKRVPSLPVFVDSPLAIKVTEVFSKYTDFYKDEIRALCAEHRNLFKFKNLRMTPTVADSKSINDVPAPKVIIAGSGMMTGWRIFHHLRRHLSDKNSILLVVGYQAAGSLGRRLIDGAEYARIFGEEIPVRAEIRKINGFSAHADNPQLLQFIRNAKDSLKHVFVVQGEEAQALHLSQEVKDRLGVQADAPTLYQEFTI